MAETQRDSGALKHRIALAVDWCMALLFLYVLGYRPGTGLLHHAMAGIFLLTLFLMHHVLNMRWHKSLLKGRYGFRRSLHTGTTTMLFAAAMLLVVSSVMVSGMVFDFAGIRMTGMWRRIHMASACWCFVLSAFHLGLHMKGKLPFIHDFLPGRPVLRLCLGSVAAGLGVFCFIRCDFAPRMFMARKIPLLTLGDAEYAVCCFGVAAALCFFASMLNAMGKSGRNAVRRGSVPFRKKEQ